MAVNTHAIVSRPLKPEEWLETFRSEYLQDFVVHGGSTVRFLSGGPSTLLKVSEGVRELASRSGFRYLHLDAGRLTDQEKRPDFHRLENLLFAITREIDWPAVARRLVVEALAERGVRFPEGAALNDLEAVALFNGRDSEDLVHEYQRLVTERILRDRRMARDFRVAVAALSRAQVLPDEMTPTTEEVLLGWLKGSQPAGSASALKRISIHEKINRSNARFVLISLCQWLRAVGEPGFVIVFDFRAYEKVKRSRSQVDAEQNERLREAVRLGASTQEMDRIISSASDEFTGVTYSQSAYLQSLELLRHLIDGIEQLPGLSLIVLASPRFFEDRQATGKERRFTDYNALQTRIGLEVHDAERQNPSAALVHLEGL